MSEASYRGRFAPSPTGPLHAGSLVAALASWLDARAQGGTWLVRIEDVDSPRCVPGADREILRQLAVCGLLPDEPPVWQSQRTSLYQAALDELIAGGKAYPCTCSRRDIEEALRAAGRTRERNRELVYPGTCRPGAPPGAGPRSAPTRQAAASGGGHVATAWRLRVERGDVEWHDRRLGAQRQDVESEVGDFVLKRADGLFAYQLAVVVDDAQQRITHVVRGEDLADNTARQLLLQRALGLPSPSYLHTPLVLGANGEKLSKQNGAEPLALHDPVAALARAGACLGVQVPPAAAPALWLQQAVPAWQALPHGTPTIRA